MGWVDELKGEITIGPATVVHPKFTIFTIAGPTVIGSGFASGEATFKLVTKLCMRLIAVSHVH
ncbi:hypothetical protein DFJ58DRAFT_657906 [Suillus subalutaceus]|uniref:uncharacterized protein n=1 Tax=Suillus subalutaceus TaxID=48586 RepID=UPI001B884627|nr:uncharacterized protein DFJ58DRAFT_657906 [Suillus subalutaceus]KAG1860268.1 hypothetical protein DFJ58DRAFT_657906 [Suillus subalutaceus]